MSLRVFHILFVAASVAMCALSGAWAVGQYRATAGAGSLALAIACFLLGTALVVYGVKVYKKLWELG